MKFLFKRYLKFEELHGSSDTIDSVREKAKHYVSKNTISSNESTVEVFLWIHSIHSFEMKRRIDM